jgi:hypothetical protein
MRLIQIKHPEKGRRIAVVDNNVLNLITENYPTCYGLFLKIISKKHSPGTFIPDLITDQKLDYDDIYQGRSNWEILPSFDHPSSHLSCMLSGTGLTHKASAENRQNMHQQVKSDEITDSMKIYILGEEGGKPEKGSIGVQPEWFYKGSGYNLKGFRDLLHIPPYADDGGEEPEIAGIYMVSEDGIPCRIGFTAANEFSDHIMERKNYLYLAPSKLRECSIGPELILNHDFLDIPGKVSIRRNGDNIWTKDIRSGEKNMCHSLENLEHHHFKYAQHRIPGMVHIHFFGADAFSFGEGLQLKDGDEMVVSFKGFGRELVNPLSISREKEKLVKVKDLVSDDIL